MAKISTYPQLSNPVPSDYLIGTDTVGGLATKNFLLSDIISLVGASGYLPYSGATNDLNLGNYGVLVDFIDVNVNPISSVGIARIVFDPTYNSLIYNMDNGTTSYIGQTLHKYVYNADVSQINKGQAVYLYQESSGIASVKLAYNTNNTVSSKILGLAAEDIPSGQSGMIMCQGVISGVNTSAYTSGDVVYLGSTAGTITSVQPSAPNNFVHIGIVEVVDATNGSIYVNPQDGFTLNQIDNVLINSPLSSDVLSYTGALWENKNIFTVIGYTPENTLNKGVANGYAPLNGAGQVDAIYLPSYVDDVLEFPNFASFPVVGSSGIIYIDLSTNNSYRWGGTVYVLMNSGSAVWGSISGVLSSQLDLNSALLGKASTLTTISTSSPLSGGGDLSTNRTFSISQSTTSTDGYLSSTDWNTFNGKVSTSRNVNTSSPLSGGGDLSVDRTISISQSTSSSDGYLSSTDWSTFNSKISSSRTINTSSPLSGGGDLSVDRTISIAQATALTSGYLSSTDWNTFNGKQNALGFTPVPDSRTLTINGTTYDLTADRTWTIASGVTSVTGSTPISSSGGSTPNITISQANSTTNGYLSSTDWTTFNSKASQDTFAIFFITGSMSPADATTYYFGQGNISNSTVATNLDFGIGIAFKIVGVQLSISGNSALGSSELSTLQIRNTTQATSSSVGTFVTTGSTATSVNYTYTGLNISVASGDLICLQWDTPTWTNNPTGTFLRGHLICERQ